jgi:hypothetical protein
LHSSKINPASAQRKVECCSDIQKFLLNPSRALQEPTRSPKYLRKFTLMVLSAAYFVSFRVFGLERVWIRRAQFWRVQLLSLSRPAAAFWHLSRISVSRSLSLASQPRYFLAWHRPEHFRQQVHAPRRCGTCERPINQNQNAPTLLSNRCYTPAGIYMASTPDETQVLIGFRVHLCTLMESHATNMCANRMDLLRPHGVKQGV